MCTHTTINIELVEARAHLPTQQIALWECSVDTQLAGDFWVDQLSERHQKEREKNSLGAGRLMGLHSTPGITLESKGNHSSPYRRNSVQAQLLILLISTCTSTRRPSVSAKLGNTFKYLCISSLHLRSSSKTQLKGFVWK